MRISDWSSDVCSSDLLDLARQRGQGRAAARRCEGRTPSHDERSDRHLIARLTSHTGCGECGDIRQSMPEMVRGSVLIPPAHPEIGRESCRERVSQYLKIMVGAVS